jgi:hypothetical protein
MLDKLKADFDRIIELVSKTPAPLQETAFKMIHRAEACTAAHAAFNSCNRRFGSSGGGRSGCHQAIPHRERHHDRNP